APDLPIGNEGHLPRGRDVRRVAAADLSRQAAGEAHRPQRLLRAGRIVGGVRVFPFVVASFAADEYESFPVRAPGQLGQLLAVVSIEVRERSRSELGAFRGPDIAPSLVVGKPGQPVALRGSRELRGKGRAEYLFDRKWHGHPARGKGRSDLNNGRDGHATKSRL